MYILFLFFYILKTKKLKLEIYTIHSIWSQLHTHVPSRNNFGGIKRFGRDKLDFALTVSRVNMKTEKYEKNIKKLLECALRILAMFGGVKLLFSVF